MRALLLFHCTYAMIGCNEIDFSTQDSLDRYRVIALQATPVEPTYRDEIQFHAFTFNPTLFNREVAQTAEYHWTICLLTLGSTARYLCADPRLELSFTTDAPDLSFNLSDYSEELQSLYAVLNDRMDEWSAITGETIDLKTGIPMSITLKAQLKDVGEDQIVKGFRVFGEDHISPSNPVITHIALSQEQLYTGEVITTECHLSDSTRASVTEHFQYSWYATSGAWQYMVRAGQNNSNQLTLPDFSGPMLIMVAVRNGLGGVDVLEKELQILGR